MHRRTENACVSHELIASADPIAVGADQRQILAAVLHAPTCGELGDGRSLARPGRSDDRHDPAAHAGKIVNHRQVLDQQRQRNVRWILQRGAPRRERRERQGHVGRYIQRREFFEDPHLQGFTQALVIPRHAGEAGLQHLTQFLQFALHGAVFRIHSPRGRCRGTHGHGRCRRMRSNRRRRLRHHHRRRSALPICLDEQGFVIVDGGDHLDTVITAATGENDGIGPLLSPNQGESRAHAGRGITFYLHVNLHESSISASNRGNHPNAAVFRNLVVGEHRKRRGGMAH